MSRTIKNALLGISLLIVLGCGGSNLEVYNPATYAGYYEGSYSRVDGGVTAALDTSGQIVVSVGDDSGKFYEMTTRLDQNGAFSARDSSDKVTISGRVQGFDTGRQISLTVSGEINLTCNLPYTADTNTNAFLGTYDGNFVGSRTMSAVISIQNNGEISIIATGATYSGEFLATRTSASNFNGSGDIIDGELTIQTFVSGTLYKTASGGQKIVGSWTNGLGESGTFSATRR